MTISNIDTYADLIILGMVDFDVILGMDWLSHYHEVMDCFANTFTLSMYSIPLVVWQGAISHEPMRIITYIYARRLILRGYEFYLTYIYDTSVKVCHLNLFLLFISFLMCSLPTCLVSPLFMRLILLFTSSLTPDLFLCHLTIWLRRA